MTVSTSERKQSDPEMLHVFLGQVVSDFGAIVSAAATVIGDELGLYQAMADGEPVTSVQVAERTGTDERYVREWLLNQAAGGYVAYDAMTGGYRLPPEQAEALVNKDSPAYVAAGFKLLLGAAKIVPSLTEAFRTGEGLAWGTHDAAVFDGTARFFRPGYAANLVHAWIPALEGVQQKLDRGGTVADVGCGHGESTILMAQAFPHSRFFGFDSHAPSIDCARRAADEAGVADRIVFEIADASQFPGSGFDMIAFFDAFHDLGDPLAAARHARERLAPDGKLLLVEPAAGDTVQQNLNPRGRLFSGGSLLICVPHALATGGTALGNQASEHELRDVLTRAGFTHVRVAAETPFNRIFEAR
jgi:SAM-dependent methyltransferase